MDRRAFLKLTASIDGGDLGTNRQDVSVGGVVRRFDYFADVSRFKTDNSVPNNDVPQQDVRGAQSAGGGQLHEHQRDVPAYQYRVRRTERIQPLQIADDSSQTTDLTFASVSADSQTFRTVAEHDPVWLDGSRLSAT